MLSGSCDDLVDADRRCCGGVDLKSSDDVSLLGQLTSLFVKSQAISSRRFESFQRSLRWRLDGLLDVFRSRSLLWMEAGWFLSLYEAVLGQLHVDVTRKGCSIDLRCFGGFLRRRSELMLVFFNHLPSLWLHDF